MERPVRTKFNTQIYEEACEWFIECRAGDLDDIARVEFDRWLRKSPEHQSAYLEIAAIWNEGSSLDPANRWDVETLIAKAAEDSSNVVALERTARPTREGRDPRQAPTTPAPATTIRRRRLFAIAASALLVTAALATYLLVPQGVYATTLGEQRSLALNDGSTVQLNSLSEIRIRYTEQERTVDLLKGQALFHIANDSTRPFVVCSGQTRIRAVGTQFDVYRKSDGTVVTVVEGRVAVRQSHEGSEMREHEANDVSSIRAGDGAILLAAGEQIIVTPQTAQRTSHPDVAGATAWTQRQLVFDAASLTDVANEFNRYNERKLVIDPSALGTQHISGVFSSTDPASLIRFLRDRPGLRVTETSTQIRVERNQ